MLLLNKHITLYVLIINKHIIFLFLFLFVYFIFMCLTARNSTVPLLEVSVQVGVRGASALVEQRKFFYLRFLLEARGSRCLRFLCSVQEPTNW